MNLLKLAVLVIVAFLLGAVVERARQESEQVTAASSEPPVAASATAPTNRFEQYRAAPAAERGPWEDYQRPPAAGDDQINRINAKFSRDRQIEEDAKVQAKAFADELERR